MLIISIPLDLMVLITEIVVFSSFRVFGSGAVASISNTSDLLFFIVVSFEAIDLEEQLGWRFR